MKQENALGEKKKLVSAEKCGKPRISKNGSEIKLTSFNIFRNCIKRANNLVNLKKHGNFITKEQIHDSYIICNLHFSERIHNNDIFKFKIIEESFQSRDFSFNSLGFIHINMSLTLPYHIFIN